MDSRGTERAAERRFVRRYFLTTKNAKDAKDAKQEVHCSSWRSLRPLAFLAVRK
jgi:hypothetical protein